MTETFNIIDRITSLEIAEITGKGHYHVMRDIRKMEEAWVNLNQSKFGLVKYTDKKGEDRDMYSLTKTECLYIATKFNDTARAKLVLRWEELERAQSKPMSTLDMVQASIDAIRANQRDLLEVRKDINDLKAKAVGPPNYYTIVGYSALNKIRINFQMAREYGKEASKYCRERGIPTDEIPDPRYGRVRLYPCDVLDKIFLLS